MIRPLPDAPARVVRDGVFCYLGSWHPSGPHVTPVVFALHASRLWVTTSRRSVKARSWRRESRVGGLIRADDRSVSFTGRITTYDLLEPGSWPRSMLHAPGLTRAASAFTAKNARFFAGYAVDAYRVPLSWTPPGRVFASVELDRIALVRHDRVGRTWGRYGGRREYALSFRTTRGPADPLAGVPAAVRERLGEAGRGVIGIETSNRSLTVLPCRWTVSAGSLYAALPADVLGLAAPQPEAPMSLTIDHASQWRARAMAGVLAQGSGRVYEMARLRSGARPAERIAESAGIDPAHAALVRVRPRRLVWWSGWDSGTVKLA